MIFVTVGTQLPFDRLVAAVDRWAGAHPDVEFVAQVGAGAAPTRHLRSAPFVDAPTLERFMNDAELIVAHTGMGSILTALSLHKPIVVMPRRAALGEHRNDHQLATAKWVGRHRGVHVAWDERELVGWLDRRAEIGGGTGIGEFASVELVGRLRAVLFG